jgi:hypothetical protein
MLVMSDKAALSFGALIHLHHAVGVSTQAHWLTGEVEDAGTTVAMHIGPVVNKRQGSTIPPSIARG